MKNIFSLTEEEKNRIRGLHLVESKDNRITSVLTEVEDRKPEIEIDVDVMADPEAGVERNLGGNLLNGLPRDLFVYDTSSKNLKITGTVGGRHKTNYYSLEAGGYDLPVDDAYITEGNVAMILKSEAGTVKTNVARALLDEEEMAQNGLYISYPNYYTLKIKVVFDEATDVRQAMWQGLEGSNQFYIGDNVTASKV